MKIGVIQASSQKEKNELIYNSVKKAVKDKNYEVINLGIFAEEKKNYSYIQMAIWISILLESKAVDFIVTGCSSGQGMMLACNSMPGVICGYIENPADAYLFATINNGNAVSYPLGLNFGWAGELNLQSTLDKLFEEEFGIGYPKKDSERKKRDTKMLKEINSIAKRSLQEVLQDMDKDLLQETLKYDYARNYVMKYGKDEDVKQIIFKLLEK
ncbi:MAG: RpiB/LacA/LacB family sugar-phosphate isomerase [Clostridiaceae bacterium]|nr:RpiB/LacA/LacB family sugar-phosphate isomerase [Clostridiaceae bacterium]